MYVLILMATFLKIFDPDLKEDKYVNFIGLY